MITRYFCIQNICIDIMIQIDRIVCRKPSGQSGFSRAVWTGEHTQARNHLYDTSFRISSWPSGYCLTSFPSLANTAGIPAAKSSSMACWLAAAADLLRRRTYSGHFDSSVIYSIFPLWGVCSLRSAIFLNHCEKRIGENDYIYCKPIFLISIEESRKCFRILLARKSYFARSAVLIQAGMPPGRVA